MPKETGRDARIEKRKAERQSKADRSGSPVMPEKEVLGADNESFQRLVEKRKASRERQGERRREEATAKISEHEQREAAKIAALLQMARAAKSENSLWRG